MTAQVSDRFRYRGDDYDLTDLSDGQDFDISFLGLEPSMTSTACWDGYQAVFCVSESRLTLDELSVNLLQEGNEKNRIRRQGPTINGIAPLPSRRVDRRSIYYEEEFNNYYYELNLHLDFTGGMLIGDGFVEEGWGYSGFASAWHYETVFELIFEQGVVKEELDRSVPMTELRERVLDLWRKGDLATTMREFVAQHAPQILSCAYRFKG